MKGLFGYIYVIINHANGCYYLGSCKNFYKRIERHFAMAYENKHHSILFQKDFNFFGKDVFEAIIIETTYMIEPKKREQELLDSIDFSFSYNISNSATCGNTLYNHPNALDMHRKFGKLNVHNLIAFNKSHDWTGENNPNWKGGPKRFETAICPVCGKPMSYWLKTHNECRDRHGKNNSFYGHKHTEETKEKIRLKQIGKINITQSKPVMINNIEYFSLSEASRQTSIPAPTILWRIRSKNPKYNEYFYI